MARAPVHYTLSSSDHHPHALGLDACIDKSSAERRRRRLPERRGDLDCASLALIGPMRERVRFICLLLGLMSGQTRFAERRLGALVLTKVDLSNAT